MGNRKVPMTPGDNNPYTCCSRAHEYSWTWHHRRLWEHLATPLHTPLFFSHNHTSPPLPSREKPSLSTHYILCHAHANLYIKYIKYLFKRQIIYNHISYISQHIH